MFDLPLSILTRCLLLTLSWLLNTPFFKKEDVLKLEDMFKKKLNVIYIGLLVSGKARTLKIS